MNLDIARYKATGLIVRYYQTVKAHVPSIKFRKSVLAHKKQGSNENEKKSTLDIDNLLNLSKSRQVKGIVLESYQLPRRYHRLPLDDAEIEMINSGGVRN